jgi:DNA-binding response OmpR family regulator
MVEILRRHGYGVELAADGDEAVATAHIFKPHVVLLDVDHHTGDAAAVAGSLRTKAAGRSPIVMAVTTRPYGKLAERLSGSGVAVVWTMPVDAEVMAEFLGQLRGE